MGDFLFFLRSLALLGLLELVFTVVHYPANRRIRIRGDLYQIHPLFLRQCQCLWYRHDACLVAFRVNYPYLRRDYVPITPRFFFLCDVKFSS